MTHVGGNATTSAEFAKKWALKKIFCHQIACCGPCKLSPIFRDANFHLNKINKSHCDSPLHNFPCCPSEWVRWCTLGWRWGKSSARGKGSGGVEYVLPTQLPTNNQTCLFSPTDLKNGSNFLWPKMAHIPPTPKPIFWIYHQAYCNSFVRSIQRGLPSLPNRGSIATIPPSVGCLPRRSYVPTGTVNSTELINEDPKFDPHNMFLLQTNWEINSTDLRNQLNRQSLLCIKYLISVSVYLIYHSKYSTDPKYLWLYLSLCSSELLFWALLVEEVLLLHVWVISSYFSSGHKIF